MPSTAARTGAETDRERRALDRFLRSIDPGAEPLIVTDGMSREGDSLRTGAALNVSATTAQGNRWLPLASAVGYPGAGVVATVSSARALAAFAPHPLPEPGSFTYRIRGDAPAD